MSWDDPYRGYGVPSGASPYAPTAEPARRPGRPLTARLTSYADTPYPVSLAPQDQARSWLAVTNNGPAPVWIASEGRGRRLDPGERYSTTATGAIEFTVDVGYAPASYPANVPQFPVAVLDVETTVD